jgi:hypothetical protein
MSRFTFTTDSASDACCEEIAKALCDTHGMSDEEAVTLINKQWQNAVIVGEDDWIYHEFSAIWADRIFRRHKLGAGW